MFFSTETCSPQRRARPPQGPVCRRDGAGRGFVFREKRHRLRPARACGDAASGVPGPGPLFSGLSFHSLSLSPYMSVMGEQREGIKCQAASGQPRCGSRGVRTRHGGVWAALGLGDMMVQKAPGGPLGCPHTAPRPRPPAKGSPVRRVTDSGEQAGLRQPRPTVDTAKVSFLSVSRVHQGGHRTLLTLLSTDGGSVSTRELCISARRYSGE